MRNLLIVMAAGVLMSSTMIVAGQDAAKKTPYAVFTTSEGNFTVRLFEKDAPKTVANFIGLAEGTKEWTDPKTNEKVKKPYYNGLIVPSRDCRLHDSGRRSAGHRNRRAGL